MVEGRDYDGGGVRVVRKWSEVVRVDGHFHGLVRVILIGIGTVRTVQDIIYYIYTTYTAYSKHGGSTILSFDTFLPYKPCFVHT